MAAAQPLALRIRGPAGQVTLSVPGGSTFGELCALVAERTGVPLGCLELRAGFPPRLLDAAPSATLADAGLRSGDTLQAAEAAGAAAPEAAPAAPTAPAAAGASSPAPSGASPAHRALLVK